MKKFMLLLLFAVIPLAPAAEELEACCRYCTKNSKPCGNACIPLSWNCKKGEGCACSSANPRAGQGAIYQQGFSDGYTLQWESREQELREEFLKGYQHALQNIRTGILNFPEMGYDRAKLLIFIDGVAQASSVLIGEQNDK